MKLDANIRVVRDGTNLRMECRKLELVLVWRATSYDVETSLLKALEAYFKSPLLRTYYTNNDVTAIECTAQVFADGSPESTTFIEYAVSDFYAPRHKENP